MGRFRFLFFFFFSISPLPFTFSQPIYSLCDRSRNFTASSPFQANLDRLIGSLIASTPSTGFANNTIGDAPDVIYGLAVCRGDLGFDHCRNCLSNATNDAKSSCPGNKGGTVFYADCLLRYSDVNFLGRSTYTQWWIANGNNVTTTPVPLFNRLLGGLLNNLTAQAATSSRRFAADSVVLNDFQRVYALVQCTGDLSPRACSDCLKDEIGTIPTCCNGKRGARVYGGSCFIRYEIYPFVNDSSVGSGSPLPPPPTAISPPPQASPAPEAKKNQTATIVVAIGVSIFAVVAFSAFIVICKRKKKQEDPFREKLDDASEERDSLIFSLDDLKLATLDFSDQNKLGEGGFGKVYKGTLKDGQIIAVKRLVNNDGEGLDELRNEVALVAKLQHRNLVRLLGYCLQAQEKILVYEYLSNKSLDKFLFDPSKSKFLTWEKRMRIIEGIGRGLLYLHEDSRFKIIHRDLKANNILLDENMTAKIADFGLARLFGNEQSYGNTQRIAGTYGYMAPEYVMHGHISTKSDVYSFGVLLLEILTGKRCVGFHGSSPPTDFLSYISRLWMEGNPLNFLDKDIADCCPPDLALRCFHVGLLCIQLDPLERPNMSHVVLFLSSSSISLPPVSPVSEYNYTSTIRTEYSNRKSLTMRSLPKLSSPIDNGASITDRSTLELR
ncbi:cysteine-rich receptor-like protein kinase 10 isoform X2 [Wolffia australiana]